VKKNFSASLSPASVTY